MSPGLYQDPVPTPTGNQESAPFRSKKKTVKAAPDY